MDPEESDGGRGVDVFAGPVTCCTGDGTADCEAEDDGCGFHDWGAELLDYDYGYEDAEAEADEFWVSPLYYLLAKGFCLLWEIEEGVTKQGASEH